MNATQLINISQELFNMPINILEQTKGGKWYECEYTKDFEEIKVNTVYGVAIDNTVEFDFKTGKNEDTIIKTFITQFISKYESKRLQVMDGEVRKLTVKEVKAKIKNNNRVSKYFFYTTLYGIGYFCLFNSAKSIADTHKLIGTYLDSNGIRFNAEFSDAGWVYRFVINKDVKIHNKLLSNLSI